MNNYETIIWDWNGTLLDDVWLCVEIANVLLQNHTQQHLSAADYKNTFGFPVADYYQKIGIDLEKETFEELTKKFISNYHDSVKKCGLQKNAIEVLEFCKIKRLPQFILTAAHKESVLPLLDHFSIRDYFVHIEGLDNYRAESKVERGLHLINNNNIKKEKTVLVGDTGHDYEVAMEMGVDCILIANGHQSKQRLINKTSNKIKVLDRIGELKRVLQTP